MSFNDAHGIGKLVQTLTGAISAPTAAESLATTGMPTLQVMLVGTTIYVQAGASVLESTMGLPAAASTANAGKWISVQSGDSAFSQLSGQLTLSSELNTYIPATALRRGKTTTVAGHRVIPITGRPASSSSNKGESVSVAVYLSTKATYLPVGVALDLGQEGNGGNQRDPPTTRPVLLALPTRRAMAGRHGASQLRMCRAHQCLLLCGHDV